MYATQVWVVTNISMEFLNSFLRHHFAMKPDGFTECRLFSQAQLLRAQWSKMWEISILLRSNDHGNRLGASSLSALFHDTSLLSQAKG